MSEEVRPSIDRQPPPPPWVEPRRRRAARAPRAPLDRDRIVAASLRIVDAEGVDALSVRRLASELGVAPMSLYWHVRDKAELLDLVGEAVLGTIEVPPAAGSWREQLRAVHLAMLRAAVRHPNTADLMIGRARYGPAGIRLFERLLSILLEAGFSPLAAFDAYQSLYMVVLGHLAMAGRSPEFRDVQRQGVLYLRSLDPEAFPAIGRIAPVIGARPPIEQFEIALDAAIAGIAAQAAR